MIDGRSIPFVVGDRQFGESHRKTTTKKKRKEPETPPKNRHAIRSVKRAQHGIGGPVPFSASELGLSAHAMPRRRLSVRWKKKSHLERSRMHQASLGSRKIRQKSPVKAISEPQKRETNSVTLSSCSSRSSLCRCLAAARCCSTPSSSSSPSTITTSRPMK